MGHSQNPIHYKNGKSLKISNIINKGADIKKYDAKNHEKHQSTNICDFPSIRERKPKIRSKCEIKLKIEFPTHRYKLQSPDASENDITGEDD